MDGKAKDRAKKRKQNKTTRTQPNDMVELSSVSYSWSGGCLNEHFSIIEL